MSQAIYVILGFIMIVVANYTAALAVVFFYFYLAKIKESVVYRFRLAFWLLLASLIAQFLGLVIFSFGGLWLYAGVTFILSLSFYLLVMRLGYKYHILENMIIATSLALILNPLWLKLFGIIL